MNKVSLFAAKACPNVDVLSGERRVVRYEKLLVLDENVYT